MSIKGHTAFSKLMPDFIERIGIDRMHCVDGGVVKKILLLWFELLNFELFRFLYTLSLIEGS